MIINQWMQANDNLMLEIIAELRKQNMQCCIILLYDNANVHLKKSKLSKY